MEIELKPCPFCGGEAILEEAQINSKTFYKVRCKTNHCTEEYGWRSGLQKTIDTWNRRAEVSNRPLILEELRTLPEKEWVWIECLEPIPYTNGSAYYCKIDAIRPEVMFECGYPGWGTAFRYENYGKTWLAYRRKPEEEQAWRIWKGSEK